MMLSGECSVLWLVLGAVGFQVVLPLSVLLWLWRRRATSRLEWLAGVATAVSILAAVSLVLPWSIVPWYTRHVYAVGVLGLVIFGWLQVRHTVSFERFGTHRLVALAIQVLLTAVLAVAVGLAVAGRVAPNGPHPDVACPFPSGTYLVVNGGNSGLLNSHLATLDPAPRFLPWRGQSHGIDLVRLDRWGLRADAVGPTDPSRYHIYGQMVTAPCTGTVVSTANDRPDMPALTRDPDRTQLAGNHVLLACTEIEVLLAHLQRGSVRVASGDRVARGAALGLVGNSGNTDEPHLHLSAQRRAPGDALIGGDPVPVTIDGRYLARNDRLMCGTTQ
jgi:hypothetical protein